MERFRPITRVTPHQFRNHHHIEHVYTPAHHQKYCTNKCKRPRRCHPDTRHFEKIL